MTGIATIKKRAISSFFPVGDEFSTDDDQWDAQYEAYWRSRFGGKINPSLLDLKHLIYLDLSGNNFNGTQIPKFLGSMGSLRYLISPKRDLGDCFPSNLHYLNLGGSSYYNNLYVMNLQWLSGLPLLRHLDLSSNNFSGSIPASIGSLINLESLHLYNNKFSGKLYPC